MPKHRVVKWNDSLIFNQISQFACLFTFNIWGFTKSQYPFDLKFSVDNELVENRLIINYCINNNDIVSMPFTWVGYTAFRCSFDSNTKLSDYVIKFPNNASLYSLTWIL